MIESKEDVKKVHAGPEIPAGSAVLTRRHCVTPAFPVGPGWCCHDTLPLDGAVASGITSRRTASGRCCSKREGHLGGGWLIPSGRCGPRSVLGPLSSRL